MQEYFYTNLDNFFYSPCLQGSIDSRTEVDIIKRFVVRFVEQEKVDVDCTNKIIFSNETQFHFDGKSTKLSQSGLRKSASDC